MTDFLVWADVETTGLDAKNDKLLEVALIITDTELNELHRYSRMVYYTSDEVEEMRKNSISYVQDMHDKTGLWTRLNEATLKNALLMSEIDHDISYMMDSLEFSSNPTFYLAGNSVKLDFAFIQENLPETFTRLHYRTIDMSSMQLTLSWWCGIDKFKKELRHEALADIEESLAQARYFKKYLTNEGNDCVPEKFTQETIF